MKRADRRGSRASDLLPPPPLIPAVHQDEGSVPPCIRRPPLHPLVTSSPSPPPLRTPQDGDKHQLRPAPFPHLQSCRPLHPPPPIRTRMVTNTGENIMEASSRSNSVPKLKLCSRPSFSSDKRLMYSTCHMQRTEK